MASACSRSNADNCLRQPGASGPIELNEQATLAWRWRVESSSRAPTYAARSGDDGAAKVCVFFDFPADRLSVGERTRLSLARRATGEAVPTETLCYVGQQGSQGQCVRRRVHEAQSGWWCSIRRCGQAGQLDQRAPQPAGGRRRAFGEEAGDIRPDVTAVAISADATMPTAAASPISPNSTCAAVRPRRRRHAAPAAAAPPSSRPRPIGALPPASPFRRHHVTDFVHSSPARAPPWSSPPRWRRALGAPVPAVPFLVVAGGLTVGGQLSFVAVVLAAVLGNILGDGVWFLAGRRWGYA